jgi:uncharacterized iron-regulated membrane protein
MTHEMFALQRASEATLDLAMAGVAVGLVVMALGIGFLLWRERTRVRRRPGARRQGTRKRERR